MKAFIKIIGLVAAIIVLITAVIELMSLVARQNIPTVTPIVELKEGFAGSWEGIDSWDGSIITLSLSQTGDELLGTTSDTFSLNVEPPGFFGGGRGTVLSPTTAEIIFNLSRWDEKTIVWNLYLTLSNQNNTLTADACRWNGVYDTDYSDPDDCYVILERQ